MIYDYIDISTKYYISYEVRQWVKTADNAMIILQNERIKEITESDLSIRSSDDVVWTVLYLIGVGLLRYIVDSQKKSFQIALNPHWRKPGWLKKKLSMQRMNRHIDFLMQHEQECTAANIPLTPLIPSLDMAKYLNFCMAPPQEPNRDPAREIAIIRRNRRLANAKLQFHRGR